MLKSLVLYFMRTMYENNFFTELFFYIVIKNNLCKPFKFNVFMLGSCERPGRHQVSSNLILSDENVFNFYKTFKTLPPFYLEVSKSYTWLS